VRLLLSGRAKAESALSMKLTEVQKVMMSVSWEMEGLDELAGCERMDDG
jgi:hypothetical protein